MTNLRFVQKSKLKFTIVKRRRASIEASNRDKKQRLGDDIGPHSLNIRHDNSILVKNLRQNLNRSDLLP